jgi:hypothetical protein
MKSKTAPGNDGDDMRHGATLTFFLFTKMVFIDRETLNYIYLVSNNFPGSCLSDVILFYIERAERLEDLPELFFKKLPLFVGEAKSAILGKLLSDALLLQKYDPKFQTTANPGPTITIKPIIRKMKGGNFGAKRELGVCFDYIDGRGCKRMKCDFRHPGME